MHNILSRHRDGHMCSEKLSEPIGCNYRLSFHKDVWRYEVEVDSTYEAINLLAKYANDDEELYSEGSLEAGDFTFDFYGVPYGAPEEEEEELG